MQKQLRFMIIGLFAIYSMVSCKLHQEPTSIRFVFDNPETDSIQLAIIGMGAPKQYSKVSTAKNETLYFENNLPRYMSVRTPQSSAMIYLENGQQVVVNCKGEQLSFDGDLADEAEFLNEKGVVSSQNSKSYSEEWLKQRQDELDRRLKELDKADVSDVFKEMEEQRLKLTHYYNLINAPSMQAMFGSEQPVMCENYYDFLEDFNVTSDAITGISGWYKPLFDIFHQMEKEGIIDADVDDFLKQHCSRIVPQGAKEAYVLEGLNFLLKYDYRDNIDRIAVNVLPVLKSESAQRRYHQIMDAFKEAKNKFAPLAKGSLAPDFEGTSPDGTIHRLSDYKGKVVLVDIWFLGCAPCKVEMPYLMKLEEELQADDLLYITFSLDREQDVEKWKHYVSEHHLGGLQLNNTKGFKASIVKDYMLRGVPRYLIINRDGTIYNAFAPRPSDPKLKKELIKLLNQ